MPLKNYDGEDRCLSTSPFKTLRSSQLTAPDAVTLSKQPAVFFHMRLWGMYDGNIVGIGERAGWSFLTPGGFLRMYECAPELVCLIETD